MDTDSESADPEGGYLRCFCVFKAFGLDKFLNNVILAFYTSFAAASGDPCMRLLTLMSEVKTSAILNVNDGFPRSR